MPTLGESVTEATVGKWFKKPGDAVKVDEPLVELETDKVTVEVPAPAAGVLAEIKVRAGRDGRDRRRARRSIKEGAGGAAQRRPPADGAAAKPAPPPAAPGRAAAPARPRRHAAARPPRAR